MNVAPVAATPSPANAGSPAGPWPGDDFPSWISPMLVKELRQGVQSGAFAWTFILLQAGMFVLMTFWVVERSTAAGLSLQTNRGFHAWFWAIFGLAAIFVLPFRASGSMAAERTGNTLDLLRLTHLSSTQIVFGKWLAIMAQVALLATAVLPYLVLQYFFGGLDLISDLFTFVAVLLGASVMTAASVSTAGQPAWSRGLLALFTLIFFVNVMGASPGSSLGVTSLSLWSSLPALGIVAGLLTAVFLVYAAATIAPPAENHAFRARLLALVAATLALFATQVFGPLSAGFVVAVALAMVAGIAIAELIRDPVTLLGIHAPFARFGIVGRLGAALFTPGWATAVCFTLVAATILGVACTNAAAALVSAGRSRLPELFLLGVAAILFPLPFMLRFPLEKTRKTIFSLVQCVSFVLFLFASATTFGRSGSQMAASYGVLASLFPLGSFFELLFLPARDSQGPTLALPLAVTGLALMTIVPRLLRELAATDARVTAAGRLTAKAPSRPRSTAA